MLYDSYIKILYIEEYQVLLDESDYENVTKWVWQLDSNGYVRRTTSEFGFKKGISLHRFLMGLEDGDRRCVDHINGNKLDNRRCNLRVCSVSTNAFNSKKGTVGCKSSFKGVGWYKHVEKFNAKVTHKYDQINLYLSVIELECAYAYDYAIKLLAIEHAYLNNVIIEDENIKRIIEAEVERKLRKYGKIK